MSTDNWPWPLSPKVTELLQRFPSKWFVFLSFCQNKHAVYYVCNLHEMVTKAGLHHDPVHGTRKVDVCGQENNVFALQRGDGLVDLCQVGHDLFQGPLPLATGARAGATVGSVFAGLLVVGLLSVKK